MLGARAGKEAEMKHIATLLLGALAFAQAPKLNNEHAVAEWAHGFKTARVIATRYSNPTMGFNIGFTFPKNPAQCDDSKLFKFMEAKGGWVYQGGGAPVAEMFVVFKGVSDKELASKKIKEILPELSKLVASLK